MARTAQIDPRDHGVGWIGKERSGLLYPETPRTAPAGGPGVPEGSRANPPFAGDQGASAGKGMAAGSFLDDTGPTEWEATR